MSYIYELKKRKGCGKLYMRRIYTFKDESMNDWYAISIIYVVEVY